MPRAALLAWIPLALLVSSPLPGGAGSRALEDEIRDLAEARLERHGSPSLSVAVISGGRVALATAGHADPEAGVPATPDTLYQAASLSKLVTATLVARQVERGKLELDAAANRYLPPERWIRDRSGEPVAATIRQLLTHTAGLPVRGTGGDPMALDAYLVDRLRTVREPGRKIIYSNQGYALLGYLAAGADAQTFPEHARTVLFEPLGMDDSSFRPPREFESRLPVGYGGLFGVLRGRVERKDTSPLVPAAGLITTARDLARFSLLFLQGGELDGQRILRPESVAEMLRIHARQHPALDEGYGLGFMVRERGGQVLAWHDGGIPGASARLALDPGLGVAAIALSNSNAAEAPTGFVADALTRLGRREAEPAPEPGKPAKSAPASASYRLVDVLAVDQWYLNPFFNLEIDADGDAPVLRRFPVLSPLEIEPLGPNRFLVRGWLIDGAVARIEGDRLYVGIIEARRVAGWESARAFLAYGIALVLAAPGLLLVRWRRRVRS